MGVEVVKADWNGVTLRAPLAPTTNHRKTVFGGSASALAILAAWVLFVCSDAPIPAPVPILSKQPLVTFDAPPTRCDSCRGPSD
jgi:thioesterase domain-containing protein